MFLLCSYISQTEIKFNEKNLGFFYCFFGTTRVQKILSSKLDKRRKTRVDNSEAQAGVGGAEHGKLKQSKLENLQMTLIPWISGQLFS